jgi:hypothetical protein
VRHELSSLGALGMKAIALIGSFSLLIGCGGANVAQSTEAIAHLSGSASGTGAGFDDVSISDDGGVAQDTLTITVYRTTTK